MSSNGSPLQSIIKSKFVRSIFLQVVAIFLVVGTAIVTIVFMSFASEIKKNIITDRQKQLAVIEKTISERMDEAASICYQIGMDSTFYLEPVESDKHNGIEMSNMLARYLVGNGFIEYLAYYRLSEPDKIYVSKGELSFTDFWTTYLHFDRETALNNIRQIQKLTSPNIITLNFGEGMNSFFAYVCPLPQLSPKPQAFVLMLIPFSEVEPLLQTQLLNSNGELAVFDADGNEIYSMSTLDENIPIDIAGEEDYVKVNGKQYVVQKQVSESNSWTYVSIICMDDIISGLASRQLVFIVLLLAVMFVAITVMLICIVVQYKPISNLAEEISESAEGAEARVVDEGSLLSSRFAALKDDSDQKQHFEMAYHEAEAANKAKSAFLSSMSHDIRTPMNAIVGMTAIASKSLNDPEYVGECLKKIDVASQYLLDIINNVLDMSRIESGRVTLAEETVELPKIAHDLITILNQSLEAKGQRFVAEAEDIENEHVIGDSVRLMQVFMNILSNSVKFTPEGGTISLRMSQQPVTEAGWGDYVFMFSDNGIGMAPEFVGQVFDTFSRAGGAKVEGTGLGMAIAKNLVELMGGSIACQSELGKGTTFTVRLHMRLAESESEAKAGEKDYSGMTALVICENDCEMQLKTFAEVGARAEHVRSAAEAAGLIRQKRYRAVIINQSPADRNGIAAISELMSAAGKQDTEYVLAAEELNNIRQSDAKDAGIAAIVQLPLFRSTVRFILDRSYYDAPGIVKRSRKTALDLTGKRVLVVEDNNMNRMVARRIISETRIDIVEAMDGKEAVDVFTSKPEGYFDLILMDVQMPVMNGYEATAAIRGLERQDAAAVPIYALTANTFDEDVRQVREAGMNGHIGKPYTPDALFRLLDQVFSAQ